MCYLMKGDSWLIAYHTVCTVYHHLCNRLGLYLACFNVAIDQKCSKLGFQQTFFWFFLSRVDLTMQLLSSLYPVFSGNITRDNGTVVNFLLRHYVFKQTVNCKKVISFFCYNKVASTVCTVQFRIVQTWWYHELGYLRLLCFAKVADC